MPRKPVGNSFEERVANTAVCVGTLHAVEQGSLDPARPRPRYEHPRGTLWIGDSLAWLASLEDASVDLVVADPPYNIGKADWDQFPSMDEYIDWSLAWITQVARVLNETGSLYVCGFSEVLADLRRPAARLFANCKWLVWAYKNKANLGKSWGRSHESILYLRKGDGSVFNIDDVRVPYGRHTLRYPDHPQAESSQFSPGGRTPEKGWRPHPDGAKPRDFFEIPVTSNGMPEKTPHPTQKPEELLRRLILASSDPDALVVDPFAGSGTTLVCAQQLGRRWAGCELSPEYTAWAAMRLEEIEPRSPQDWITHDRDNARRRESIR